MLMCPMVLCERAAASRRGCRAPGRGVRRCSPRRAGPCVPGRPAGHPGAAGLRLGVWTGQPHSADRRHRGAAQDGAGLRF